MLAAAVPPAINGFTIQTTLKNGIVVSDVPGPTGGILIQTTTGAMISVSDVGIIISNGMGMPLFFLQTRTQHGLWEMAPPVGCVVCRLEEVPLVPGDYLLTIGCMTGERQLDLLEHVASFSVEPRDFFDSGYLPHPLNGPVLIRSEWKLQ